MEEGGDEVEANFSGADGFAGAGDGVDSEAIGKDFKGKLSVALYLAAIPLAFVSPWISSGIYIFTALMWLVPDRRIEHAVTHRDNVSS